MAQWQVLLRDLSTYLKSLPTINSDQPVGYEFYAFAKNAFRHLLCSIDPPFVVFGVRCVESHVFTPVFFLKFLEQDLINSSVTTVWRARHQGNESALIDSQACGVLDDVIALLGQVPGQVHKLYWFSFGENHWGGIKLNIERLGYTFNRVKQWILRTSSTSGFSHVMIIAS